MLMNNLKLDIGQLDNSDQINIVKQFKFIKEEYQKKFFSKRNNSK